MKNWIGLWKCLSRSLSIGVVCIFGSASFLFAQNHYPASPNKDTFSYSLHKWRLQDTVATSGASKFPKPKSVLYKSLIIPGWGQVTNKQTWKVPIIYGLLGGLTYYSIFLTKRYHDYRAAFYNLNEQTPNDFRFGPTPAYLSGVTNLQNLRVNRNSIRNRRDFSYIAIGLAYGLNIVDAYVFAHLRSFDVSEDLSLNASLGPTVTETGSPGVSLSIKLFKK